MHIPLSHSYPIPLPSHPLLFHPHPSLPLLFLPLLTHPTERIRNLLAAVEGADKDEEGAAGDDEAEGSVGGVACVVCGMLVGGGEGC